MSEPNPPFTDFPSEGPASVETASGLSSQDTIAQTSSSAIDRVQADSGMVEGSVGGCESRLVMLELLGNEKTYFTALRVLLKFFNDLRDPSIIPREKEIVAGVLSHIVDLHKHHGPLSAIGPEQLVVAFLAKLKDSKFLDTYQKYMTNYAITVYWFNYQMDKNPAFKQLFEKYKSEARLDMKDYISLPYFKLMRDKMIFERLSKHGNEQKILEVVNRLNAFLEEIDRGPDFALVQWKINLHRDIDVKWDTINLDLFNPKHSLLHTGYLLWSSGGLSASVLKGLRVFLFNDCLLMAKYTKHGGVSKYRVRRKFIIRLEKMTLVDFAPIPNPEIPMFPFTIRDNFRNREWVFYARSAAIRSEWEQRLQAARDRVLCRKFK